MVGFCLFCFVSPNVIILDIFKRKVSKHARVCLFGEDLKSWGLSVKYDSTKEHKKSGFVMFLNRFLFTNFGSKYSYLVSPWVWEYLGR